MNHDDDQDRVHIIRSKKTTHQDAGAIAAPCAVEALNRYWTPG